MGLKFSREIDELGQRLYMCVVNTAPGLVISYSFPSAPSIRGQRMEDSS